MKSHRCCHAPGEIEARHSQSVSHRIRRAAEWIVPGAVVVVMPKCPACVAAYVAMITGVGISFTDAAHLRIFVLALCIACLCFATWLALKSLMQRLAIKHQKPDDQTGG